MRKNKKGQAVVELSLVLPIFLLVIIGIFDFGRALHCWSSLNHQCVQAARAASKRNNQLIARNLFLSTTHTSLTDVKKVFWDSRSPIMSESDYDSINWESTGIGSNNDTVTVSASFNLTLMTPFLASLVGNNSSNSGAIKISASATEKKE
ncbi:MAG: pilus assembly protein [Candidatus Riflebacteria bacterium]|nr:pilus assembly protein [Candidatus Riflebacteria bacterium]